MTFEQIEDLLFCSETNDLVLDGDYYTDPFFAIVNHRVGDMFLFYTIDENEALVYGYVIIDPKNKTVIKHSDTNKIIRLPDSYEHKGEYKKLFEQIHEFVFNKDLTIAQLEILKRYYEILQMANFSFSLEIYNSFMPEFLTWVKRQLAL